MRLHAAARPVAASLLAAAIVTAGCSGDKKEPAAGTPAATGSSSPASISPSTSSESSGSAAPAVSGDPDAVKLYNEAVASLAKVKSVHVKGAASEGETAVEVDLVIETGKGAAGTLGINGGTMNIVEDSSGFYIKIDAAALKAFGGETTTIPESMLAGLKDKWLKVPADAGESPLGEFSDLRDLSSLASEFAPSGSLSIKDKQTINGKSAVGLQGLGDDGSVLYVEEGGDHLPLRYVPSASDGASAAPQGHLDFLDYNKPATIKPPSPDDVVDLSKLAQLGGASTAP